MGGQWHQISRIHFSYREGNENNELGTGFFLCIRESYQQLREFRG
jgi:hypothetical protein